MVLRDFQSDLSRDEFDNAAHASRVKSGSAGIRAWTCGNRGAPSSCQAEFDRVAARCVRQFIDKRLKHAAKRVAARRAHGERRHAQGHGGAWNAKFGKNVPGNSFGAIFAADGEILAFAETHEMIVPPDDLAGIVQSALQEMKSRRDDSDRAA